MPVFAADTFTSTGVKCTIVGTSGNDVLNGTAASDVICGLGGDDTISAAGGNDTVDAGPGNDIVNGGIGNDTVIGGSGDDSLNGGPGADKLTGGSGRDVVDYSSSSASVTVNLTAGIETSVAGNDTIFTVEDIDGSAFVDSLTGNGLSNHIDGLSGNDSIYGGGGDDDLYGGIGNDSIWGGDGTDDVWGDGGADSLFGDGGGDTLYGGAANDTLNGGPGEDTASYENYDYAVTVDLVTDVGTGEGKDLLPGIEDVVGGDGNDKLTGDSFANEMVGGPGNDKLYGGAGSDTLEGDAGDDTMSGDAGVDTVVYTHTNQDLTVDMLKDASSGDGNDSLPGVENMVSGSGNDTIYGDGQANEISGGDGADSIFAGGGNDIVTGDAGNDTLSGEAGNDKVDGSTGENTCDLDAGDTGINCIEDKQAPQLVSVSMSKSVVDVNSEDPTLQISVRIKENFGSIKRAQFLFRNTAGQVFSLVYACPKSECGGPSGNSVYDPDCSCNVMFWSPPAMQVPISSGTKFDGAYAREIDLRELRFGGEYWMSKYMLQDKVGNTSLGIFDTLNRQFSTFVVVGTKHDEVVADTAAPVVSDLVITSEPESGSGQTLHATFRARDDVSGVAGGSIRLFIPGANPGDKRRSLLIPFSSTNDCANATVQMGQMAGVTFLVKNACLVSGDKWDGKYAFETQVPRWILPGTYSVYSVNATDNSQNSLAFYSEQQPASALSQVRWVRAEFDYRSGEVYEFPVITGYSWGVVEVNTGKGPALQTLDVAFKSAEPLQLGIFFVGMPDKFGTVQSIYLSDDWGFMKGTVGACTDQNDGTVSESGMGGCMVSGDYKQGIVRFKFLLPQSSPAGKWSLTSYLLRDSGGAETNVDPSVRIDFENKPTS